MFDPIKLEDIGLARITIGDVEQEVDVLRANNRLAEISQQHEGKPIDGQNEAVVDLIAELGFPRCSHSLAVAFADAMAERVQQIRAMVSKKNGSPPRAASPGTTESIPSS